MKNIAKSHRDQCQQISGNMAVGFPPEEAEAEVERCETKSRDRVAFPDTAQIDSNASAPVVRLRNIFPKRKTEVFAKLQPSNLGEKPKDGRAKAVIEGAMRRGEIGKDTIVVEYFSSGLGIDLAQICCFHDIPFVCLVHPEVLEQDLKVMRALDARIVVCGHSLDGESPAANRRREIEKAAGDYNFYWPGEHANEQTLQSQAETTIRDLVGGVEGEIDYLFVSVGSPRPKQIWRHQLQNFGSSTKVIAVRTEEGGFTENLSGFVQPFDPESGSANDTRDKAEFDDVVSVSEEECVIGCRRAAKQEALLVGLRAGGIIEAMNRYTENLQDSRIAAILPDSGQRYLNTIFHDEWVENELGLSLHQIENEITG
ncbi:MAG: pyridoxal-phosphate dependent enzyme [Verrucomicrobiales bacterium]|nr:pyridoxal-phosphate dependent enzyme [Verrucomicrobiales bacterium]